MGTEIVWTKIDCRCCEMNIEDLYCPGEPTRACGYRWYSLVRLSASYVGASYILHMWYRYLGRYLLYSHRI